LEHPEALSKNKLPEVAVKDDTGNTINQVTVTKAGCNKYKVNFLSDKTSFNLNVSAMGHVAQTVNVSVSKRNFNDPVLYGQASLNLRAYNLLIISSSTGQIQNFVDAYKQLRNEGYYFNLHYFDLDEVTDPQKQEKIRTAASKADIIA